VHREVQRWRLRRQALQDPSCLQHTHRQTGELGA
jgi:hypothetical protein